MGLRDKIAEVIERYFFAKECESFMKLPVVDRDYYNELIKYKKQLHDNYSLVSANKQHELEDLLWKKIKEIDSEIDYYNKVIREGIA